MKFELVKYLIIRFTRVFFEKEIGPEFVISDHALERMQERLKTNENSFRWAVLRAWISTEEIPSWVKKKYNFVKQQKWVKYRKFGNHVYVFYTKWHPGMQKMQKYLVTVLCEGYHDHDKEKIQWERHEKRI